MVSDVPRIRYLFPRFKGNYNRLMKTLASGCAFDVSDIAQYRLKVVEFGKKYGARAVSDAFGVKRSTYFLWKQKLIITQGRLTSLVPISTRPKRVRQMETDPQIVAFIKSVREQYGRVGKNKLEILLNSYCKEQGLTPIKATAIGKIIKRKRFFFEGRRRYKIKRLGVLRVKKAPKEHLPGYIEMDSVIVLLPGRRHIFITAMDIVTKQAACLYTSTGTSARAQELLCTLQSSLPYSIRTVQTDNGSEFLGAFDQYCQDHSIPHVFTYPRSPRINGGIERFNRTIQEEFIERTDSVFQGKQVIAAHLERYVIWYNQIRPHQSLGYQSPSQYLQQLQSNM